MIQCQKCKCQFDERDNVFRNKNRQMICPNCFIVISSVTICNICHRKTWMVNENKEPVCMYCLRKVVSI